MRVSSMRAYVTTGDGTRTFEQHELRLAADARTQRRVVALYPAYPQQTIRGFGAALTEASAWVFAHMPAQAQDEVLVRAFGPAAAGGNAYTLCRTHLQSCDFSLGNYAYVRRPAPGKSALSTFSIERDRALLLPFIRCCLALQPELELVAAPWSPPGFMKTNLRMNQGGRLRKRFYEDWAQVLARAVAAWRAEGVKISALTCQNEPMATQRWDSCVYGAVEEAAFARALRAALDADACADTRLLAWDHNKERLVARMEELSAALEANGSSFDEVFAGAAFHWYTGDHFDAVRVARSLHPGAELLHTEGCAAFSAGASERTHKDAERYAHDIIGDLNAGANGWIDWNLLLNEEGGPNHVGNFCDAPLMYDRVAERLIVNRSHDYLGHFSRFIRPGAHVVPTSSYTDKMETLGAVNPDGARALVALNRTATARKMVLSEGDRRASFELPAHAIATFVW